MNLQPLYRTAPLRHELSEPLGLPSGTALHVDEVWVF